MRNCLGGEDVACDALKKHVDEILHRCLASNLVSSEIYTDHIDMCIHKHALLCKSDLFSPVFCNPMLK